MSIRFPERFHASQTPQANMIGVEPNYLEADPEDARREYKKYYARAVKESAPVRRHPFDFSALIAVMGR